MTNDDILRIALQQSALECNCLPEDFLKTENLITISPPHPQARAYLPLPFACDLVSYGGNIVAQTNEALRPVVKSYLQQFPIEHCFETPNLHVLDNLLQPHGLKVCFMAEYFLPDLNLLAPLPCKYEMRLLHPSDFSDLYTEDWSNALCAKRKELDFLGVGAFDQDTLVGLAACSADCARMYQIGVDVLPSYRRQGIASALTSRLALEILQMEKIPFYCAAWSNLKSVRNAIKAGFRPAWVELTARDLAFVASMNQTT